MDFLAEAEKEDDVILEELLPYFLGKLIVPQRNLIHLNPHRGREIIYDLLTASDTVCFEMCRMKKKPFMNLCIELQALGLKRSRHISVEEQVYSIVHLLGHSQGQRVMGHNASHSVETINRHLHFVLHFLYIWADSKIRPLLPLEQTPAYIGNNSKYFPWFKDCVGAIDGTHIKAKVEPKMQQAFRGKTRQVTQNILAVCDFSMRFIYGMAGWEGSAHDAKVLQHCTGNDNSGFPHPPGNKYYVVDAAYSNKKGFLGPYKGVRYHVPEFRRRAPSGRHEKFNQLHASLRNIIERTFGVFKERWKLFDNIPRYPFRIQTKMVRVAMALHNFIREQHNGSIDPDMRDALFERWEEDVMNVDDGDVDEDLAEVNSTFVRDDQYMRVVRDSIRDFIGEHYGLPPVAPPPPHH